MVKRIERVKELFLESVFAFEELDVINKQDVVLAVAAFELGGGVITNGVDKLAEQGLGRDVTDSIRAVVLGHVVSDRLEQVRLAQTRMTMNEQWVIRARWRLCDRESRGVSKAIGGTSDEALEGVASVDYGATSANWAICEVSDARCSDSDLQEVGGVDGFDGGVGVVDIYDDVELGAKPADFFERFLDHRVVARVDSFLGDDARNF